MKSERVTIIITEGDTDYLFYKRVLEHFKNRYGKPKSQIDKINIKGIGKFSSKVPSKFRNEIVPKYNSLEKNLFLAYDSDVFELKEKPPVNWNELEKKLLNDGASTVTHLKAKKMIEDWFIYDVEGICKSLNIDRPSKLKGNSGFEKIKYLFKRGHRIYQKGFNSNNFIEKLNIPVIYSRIEHILKPLYQKLYE